MEGLNVEGLNVEWPGVEGKELGLEGLNVRGLSVEELCVRRLCVRGLGVGEAWINDRHRGLSFAMVLHALNSVGRPLRRSAFLSVLVPPGVTPPPMFSVL